MAGNCEWKGRASKALAVDYANGREWFVVRTLPREEDQALRTLARAGFDAFLPKGKREVIRHRSKKVVEVEVPLLVGYAFLAMPVAKSAQHWGVLRDCHGVSAVLAPSGRPLALPSREVELLQLADNQGRLQIKAPRRAFLRGEMVRINGGAFFGFEGEIVEPEIKGAVELLISLFNGWVQVTVQVDQIDPL